jgi:hypothetical protein
LNGYYSKNIKLIGARTLVQEQPSQKEVADIN